MFSKVIVCLIGGDADAAREFGKLSKLFQEGRCIPASRGQATRGYQDPPAPTRTDRPPTETYRESPRGNTVVSLADFGSFFKKRGVHDGADGGLFFALKIFENL
jgi:hypothetical protein